MGAMKDLMMDIEDATWDALEKGARTKEDVFAYVCTQVPYCTNLCRNYVYSLVDSLEGSSDLDELYMMTPATFSLH